MRSKAEGKLHAGECSNPFASPPHTRSRNQLKTEWKFEIEGLGLARLAVKNLSKHGCKRIVPKTTSVVACGVQTEPYSLVKKKTLFVEVFRALIAVVPTALTNAIYFVLPIRAPNRSRTFREIPAHVRSLSTKNRLLNALY